MKQNAVCYSAHYDKIAPRVSHANNGISKYTAQTKYTEFMSGTVVFSRSYCYTV